MKIYKVIFNKYTGDMNDKIWNETVWNETKDKYIDIGNKQEFLCKECDIDFLKSYGEGFRKLELVGELFERPIIYTDSFNIISNNNTTEITNKGIKEIMGDIVIKFEEYDNEFENKLINELYKALSKLS